MLDYRDEVLNLSDLVATSWKIYSIYSLEERALPSIVDGMKPSQRFILYSALKVAKDKFAKVAEIAGGVSSYGYHHGETSAQAAATFMGAPWQNNNALLEPDGNFGSRLVKDAAAARYIHAKISKTYYDIFTDTDICPVHDDEDIKTPKFYLPIIPFVLLNGVSGIATGYRTNILPYDAKEVTKLCMAYLGGKSIDDKVLTPKFPQFRGKVEKTDVRSYDLVGTYEVHSKTKITITEVPYQYDREEYVQILDALEEDGTIVSYQDLCGVNGFKFGVTLSRNFSGDIEKVFKLRKSITENLNVITEDGKLREYTSPIQLIKDFVDLRLDFVGERIDIEMTNLKEDMALLKSKIKFIELVLKNKIAFKEKSKKELTDELLVLKFPKDHVDSVLSMNFYHLTTEEIEKLSNKYLDMNDRLDYLKGTTATIEYGIDLDTLNKKLK